MLDLVRPKLDIPDDNRIGINHYRNPYLTKLTIKVLPQYSHIKGSTFLNPLENHNNVAIVQSLPLWRNENFKIGLLWQQNIRNAFNRSHIGFLTEYNLKNNYTFKSKNLVGSSFLTSNEVSRVFALSGKIITVSALYSCFFESSLESFHTIGGGIAINNALSFNISKRIGSQTTFKINYEKKVFKDFFLRVKFDAQLQRFHDSSLETALGYYWSDKSSFWLKSAVQSDKIQPSLAVQLQYKKSNSHCFVGSVQFRNQKSIIYLGYKCPSFNLIFPIFGTDSVVPALIALGAYVYGYISRKKHQEQKKQQNQKNRSDELKLISDKANENYKKQQALNGLLIQQVFVGQKSLLNRFLAQQNKLLKLNRQQKYKNGIFDCTTSLRFYVQKGQLFLPKGNKLSILGFYYKPVEDRQIQIYIRYQKKGKEFQKKFSQNDAIVL